MLGKMIRTDLALILFIFSFVQPSSAGFVNAGKTLKSPRRWSSSEQHAHHGNRLTPALDSLALRMWSREDELKGSDRLKACIPYMLPLLDGDKFGTYIYDRIPPLGFLHELWLGPLVNIYNGIPFSGIIFFVALTLGTRGATNISRGVRFSAQQAALIDAALVFPELIGSSFENEDLPSYVMEPCMNFVWYTYMAMVIYSIYSNLRGKKPDQIPYISGYAEMVVGPF